LLAGIRTDITSVCNAGTAAARSGYVSAAGTAAKVLSSLIGAAAESLARFDGIRR
jgi:hypothetical protein